MIDHIIAWTALQILALFGLDYCNCHHFGLESALSIITALILAYIHNKEKKK